MQAMVSYELRLKNILNRRLALHNDRTTFWGKWGYSLIELEKKMKFPSKAYYKLPDDPITVFEDWYPSICLLKSRYRHRLRLQFLKELRRGKYGRKRN